MKKKLLLDPLIHLLEIESVSTQERYLPSMQKARHYLIDLFENLGFKTKILKAKKHNAVFAQKIVDSELPTVLIYGHYDVQPPEPLDEWKTPPFKPTIKKELLYARGASDNKGQFLIHIMTVKALLEKNGKLPINFKFVIEGEEEIGSISVEAMAQKYSKNLLVCNYLIVSDSSMPKPGQPAIEISLRGLVYTEVTLKSAKGDLHSGGFGGVAENPANVLAHLIAGLKDKNNRVLIPGFYDDVVPPTKQELKDYQALKTTEDQIKKEGGLSAIGGGEKQYSLNERRWSRPTLDVNGIWGGYQKEGSKTIIPAKAGAKISMRLVPNQNPDKIYKLFKHYVEKIAPKTVKVKVTEHARCLPYKAPIDHPVFDLMKDSLKKAFKRKAVFSAVGGSIGFVPIVVRSLGVPCLLVGFGEPGSNIHAPNEHFNLTNYFKGIETMTYFYENLSLKNKVTLDKKY